MDKLSLIAQARNEIEAARLGDERQLVHGPSWGYRPRSSA